MNAGIIVKIEYRLVGGSAYSEMSFTGFSASYTCEQSNTASGIVRRTKINGKVPKIGKTNSDLLKSLAGPKLDVKFTDGNGRTYTMGTTGYPARFQYTMVVGGNPGDHNGFEFTITHSSPAGPVISET